MPTGHPPPTISQFALRLFRRLVRRYFRRHFRAVLAQHGERLQESTGPLIVYGNHSSWWDPMLIVLLGDLLLPDRKHYAPIDARALERYPILRRFGIFPVAMNSPRGAAMFLRTAEAILREDGVLWLTPQGRFADPRERPLAFKAGLGALAVRMPEVPLVPLAVEYVFWDERLPETLLHAGAPLRLPPNQTTAEATRALEGALAECMRALQAAAMARDPRAFTLLITGARGTGGIYALIRRIGAVLRGRRLELDHTERSSS